MCLINKFTVLKPVIINFFLKHRSGLLNALIALTSIICFCFFCKVILNYPPPEPIWNLFGDPKDYLTQSGFSVWSKDFYMPAPAPGFTPRPFTVPLFYKIVGQDPYTIVWMQKVVYCASVFIVVNSVLCLLKQKLIRIAVLPFLYYFFTWWIIAGFTENLLSESLSMSLLFVWIASLILCIRFKNTYMLLLVVVVSTLFSFTRDTWPYIILLAHGLLFIAFYKKDQRLKTYFLILSTYSVLVFVIQSHTATVGERYKIPVYNTLVTRIVKNPEYAQWFKEKGMPLADSLLLNLHAVDPENRETIGKMYDSYTNPRYEPVCKWIMAEGKSAYMQFMVTHPSYFFLMDQTTAQTDRIFDTANHDYYLKATGYFAEIDLVFPYFSLKLLLSVNVLLLLLFFVWKPRNYWSLFPAFLMLLFLANVYLSYNADTFEVKRHLFITQVMIQLLSILSIAALADVILCKLVDLIPLTKPKNAC